LQSRILRRLLNRHSGIKRVKVLTRSYAIRPKLIGNTVGYCIRCSAVAKLLIKTALRCWHTPELEFTRLCQPVLRNLFLIFVNDFEMVEDC
uniref:Tick transposon n=1 Tax=Haemonchus placei TaxID=6290 RepID=A0A0N4WAY3_HAEPC